MIRITRVKAATKSDLVEVNRLLKQLSSSARKLDIKAYRRLLANKTSLMFAAKDSNRIVGMGWLILMEIPVAFRTRMEDLVVDEAYRGHGLGTKIIQHIIRTAKQKGGVSIDFTSRPQRGQAHKLYAKLGFEKRDTNVYRKKL